MPAKESQFAPHATGPCRAPPLAASFNAQCRLIDIYRRFYMFCQCRIATDFDALIIFCRCLSTTCAVCSRTCTHSAASQPPTPHLTWSPTPSPSPMPSPRRSVLSLNSSNVNLPLSGLLHTQTQSSATGKRRKHADEDDIPSYPDVKSTSYAEDQGEFGEGCGRFVCRNCCYEDTHKCVAFFLIFMHLSDRYLISNTTTCLDCYGSRT